MIEEVIVNESIGPILTDFDGALSSKILKCFDGDYRCKFLGIHDCHYFYCSAQTSIENSSSGDYAYPWPNAGKQLRDSSPNKGCPYGNINKDNEVI